MARRITGDTDEATSTNDASSNASVDDHGIAGIAAAAAAATEEWSQELQQLQQQEESCANAPTTTASATVDAAASAAAASSSPSMTSSPSPPPPTAPSPTEQHPAQRQQQQRDDVDDKSSDNNFVVSSQVTISSSSGKDDDNNEDDTSNHNMSNSFTNDESCHSDVAVSKCMVILTPEDQAEMERTVMEMNVEVHPYPLMEEEEEEEKKNSNEKSHENSSNANSHSLQEDLRQHQYGMDEPEHPPLLLPGGEGIELTIPNSSTGNNRTTNTNTRHVRFQSVQIREHAVTIGDHPFCTVGVPIQLDWTFYEFPAVSIDMYEVARQRKRKSARRKLLLNSFQRRDMLWRAGHELEEIELAAKAVEKQRFRRSLHLYFLPIFVLQEYWAVQVEKYSCRKQTTTTASSNASVSSGQISLESNHSVGVVGPGEDGYESEAEAIEQKVRDLHRKQLADMDSTEHGGLPPWRRQDYSAPRRQARRISFRGSGLQPGEREVCGPVSGENGSASTGFGGDNYSVHSDAEFSVVSDFSSHRAFSVHSSDFMNLHNYRTTGDSNFARYHIRTDPRQHDKATEIILCSARRPHMRAFHASWFGFFIGFIMWFAITPLLGEVKESLQITNSEIWTSSLAGTSVTVLARIIMGPLCDVFGARLCMAAIVMVSAIPCGLTGLVGNAKGLAAVRAFIGIAGSAFVPCQYWTSRMFAREVVGTANALVAGWGNLGGGVTQLLMGSVLFPLFKEIFKGEDQDGDDMTSAEMAWRTVFVVPALIAFIAGYVYLYHCDDSPKGDFTELIRQQQIEMVSPFMALFSAIQNRNVVLLLVQYACCFGIEITMTNATALYMREEFGQSTASAAAIASTFGFMNLFARGLGGYGSDFWNSRFGTHGRVGWQSFTLFMEGVGIVIFAYADTLIGSIFSLIFLSLWVQCAEGSTYGIVPYVNRRFTGKYFWTTTPSER